MQLKQSLNGVWSFRNATEQDWMTCTVPGSNYTQLLSLGKIGDPFVGTNEGAARWVGEVDWFYTRSFIVDKKMLSFDAVRLECKMLDTVCKIFINSREVAECKNAHISYSFDVLDYLLEGENNIEIFFSAPIPHIEKLQKADPAPNASMGVSGVPHIRKPQCHFGWDWGPILPISGIIKDIDLVGYDIAKINNILVKQHHSKSTTVNLDILVEATAFSKTPFSYELEILCPDKTVISQSSLTPSFEVSLLNPSLWYPSDVSGLDEQPLYKVTLKLVSCACDTHREDASSINLKSPSSSRVGEGKPDARVYHQKTQTLGLRTIELDRRQDSYGKNFCFVVNGTPVFAKGANWIPADSFIDRFDAKKTETFIKHFRDCNMNMVRVWGGGYYESDEFYECCDRYGILVWQDFGFACAPYPFYNEEFLTSVKEEIAFNIRRLRHHASLALWCGNNEIEMMTIGWRLFTKYVKYTEIFFHDILPSLVAEYDSLTPFVVGSPSSSEGFLKKVNDDNDGDTHLWHVWHGLQPLNYYRKRFTRFCSEFGLESLPDIKTVRYFARPQDYSLSSPVFLAHQKCLSGNNKMLWYMSTRFRIPKAFDELIYLTQLVQSECVKDATLHWRRNRGRCNGSLFWQLNDCWPVSSWSSIDYFGRFKALQYESKNFFAPVTLSLSDTGRKVSFFVHNDTLAPFVGKLKYTLETFEGESMTSGVFETCVEAGSATNLFTTDFTPYVKRNKNCVLVAELSDKDGDGIVARRTLLFYPEKDLSLPKCEFDISVETEGDTAFVSIGSKFFARYAWLNLDWGTAPFSDNCFDILAGEEVTVSIPRDGKTAEQIKAGLNVICVNNITPRASKLNDTLTRLKISMIPINVANWFYYHLV